MSTASDAFAAFEAVLKEHEDHEWTEIAPCVYCVPCNVRLYQGTLPESRLAPEVIEKRKTCQHLNHEGYDDGDGWREMGEGFYWVCADCGFKDWYE